MKIGDILKQDRRLLSFEFFPPRNPESEHILHETVEVLKRFEPDFVSVTYGAGGSTRDRTLQWTIDIKERYGLDVMMHLTCLASTREDIGSVVEVLRHSGIENVLALRGDPPRDLPLVQVKDDFSFACELVEYLEKLGRFSIGVAGYPEGHLESPSLETDIQYLKQKVDAGADFIITQIFFDNRYFFDFVDRAASAGIDVPIIPGIMPIVNLGQVQRFTQMCGATVPDRIVGEMEGRDDEEMVKIGIEYAVGQCRELIDAQVAGLHFYTLNRNQATELVLDEIGTDWR
ncbi:MAG: methylenetetrahydrofolate reductase [NAD(P)H] [bacterium]|nr:methylenetetrahydrofolate reductase [NAD(P)H] [bacterium]MDT8395580.1 methylenetetrahydrofolate reductase [NAD(P)H] [bacterium]